MRVNFILMNLTADMITPRPSEVSFFVCCDRDFRLMFAPELEGLRYSNDGSRTTGRL